MPTAEVLPKVESGEIVIGGCCTTGFEPTWKYIMCHAQIFQ
ncbi:hypothetical protein [Rhodohalobacter barkolensis]|nr:hypothetical protein [Rhodohalobacter barkolensis]